jgi:hypothetical protein
MALAAWRQIFFPRYLFPYMPGLLLGLALAATRFRGRLAALPAALFAVALVEAAELPQRPWMKARAYSIETASSDLMAAGSGHLAFFFDHPTTRKADAEPLARLGGFFFRRAGVPVEVSPLIPKAGQDPNAALLALADRPRSAILWMYDLSVPLTQAIAHPPRIAQTPGWTCRTMAAPASGSSLAAGRSRADFAWRARGRSVKRRLWRATSRSRAAPLLAGPSQPTAVLIVARTNRHRREKGVTWRTRWSFCNPSAARRTRSRGRRAARR